MTPHSPCCWSLWMYTGLTLLTVLPSLAGKCNWVWARKAGTCHHQYEHFVITYMTSYISKNCRNIKEMGVRIVLWWCQEVHHLQFTNKLTSQSIYEHVRGQNARSASMVLCMKWIVHAGGVCQCSHHHHHQQTCRPCWIIFVIKSMIYLKKGPTTGLLTSVISLLR